MIKSNMANNFPRKVSLKPLYIAIYFTCVFSLSFYLFYLENKLPNDIYLHIKDIPSYIKNLKNTAEFGFELSIYLLSKITSLSYTTVALNFLALVVTFLAYLKLRLIKQRFSNVQSAYFFTSCLMLVSCIYLPFYNYNLYLGQGSPNVWHNPTLLLVKIFAFIITPLAAEFCLQKNPKILIIIAGLLLISLIYKPNFGLIFIPAWGAYLAIHQNKNWRLLFYTLLAIFPSLLFLLFEKYEVTHLSAMLNESFVLAPFKVLHHYVPNLLVSFLLATAFPFAMLVFRFKQVIQNHYLQLCWLMLIFGYTELALFAETGSQMYAGNFGWGYLIALDLLFVFSFIELLNWLNNSELKNRLESTTLGFVCVLFSLHLTSGIYYLLQIFTTNNYY